MHNCRVNGSLAVSRAFGDFNYKCCSHLPTTQQQVIAEPTVTRLSRNKEKDQFLLLACDGIWDVMRNQEVADFVLSRMKVEQDRGGYSLSAIAEDLMNQCLNLNSRDNMSVLIVDVSGAPSLPPRTSCRSSSQGESETTNSSSSTNTTARNAIVYGENAQEMV